MCTLLIYREPMPGIRLAVAANRDELASRPRGEWARLALDPRVEGGIDPEAGGTWLALSWTGFLVAVTNARLGARRLPRQRSRGLLARDLALEPGPREAAAVLGRADLDRYAPVNVVVAGPEGFSVGSNLPYAEVRHLQDAELGLGNRPAFEEDRRVAELLVMARPLRGERPAAWLARLEEVLRRHQDPTACHHTPVGGTVFSTVAVLTDEGWTVRVAPGPPCTTPFVPACGKAVKRA